MKGIDKLKDRVMGGNFQLRNIDDYQKLALMTAFFKEPYIDRDISYASLGLAGEAGEVSNKIKKILRGDYDDLDGTCHVPAEVRLSVLNELGDVLWYVAALCSLFQTDMSILLTQNIIKLQQRNINNTIQGEGDNR